MFGYLKIYGSAIFNLVLKFMALFLAFIFTVFYQSYRLHVRKIDCSEVVGVVDGYEKNFKTYLEEKDRKIYESKFRKRRFRNKTELRGQCEEQKRFFEKYCKNCSSDIAILKFNPLNNLLTDNKDGWHAYFVFSPTYVLKCLKLNVGADFFDHVCLELQDDYGNLYRQESVASLNAVKKCKKLDGGVCIRRSCAHGDYAYFNILIKDKFDFNFERGSRVKVRLFCNDSFDKKNLILEFEVVCQEATYNLFSRLHENSSFYREFAHPKKLDLDFYMSATFNNRSG